MTSPLELIREQWLRKQNTSRGRGRSKPRRARRRPADTSIEWLENRIMLAVDLFLVPGIPGDVVDVKIDVAVHARYRNEVGVYAVQDGSGRVAGQLPGSPLYASAVLHGGGRQVLLPSGTFKSAAGELTVAAGTELAFYLIQNQSGQSLLTRNPKDKLSGHVHAFFSAQGLSAHGIDHVRERTLADGRSVYAFEDQLHGGDRDYNDAVLTVTVIDTIHPASPPKVSPLPGADVPHARPSPRPPNLDRSPGPRHGDRRRPMGSRAMRPCPGASKTRAP